MMKRVVVLMLCIACVLAMTSCCKTKKCKPVVRVSYMVPEFACPVPSEPNLKAITPEIVQDDLTFKKVMGDNLIELQRVNALWRSVYYECVQSIIKLYKSEGAKVDAENAEIEKANEALPR